MNKTKTVKCPACGKAALWSTENRWRPFCSERCRIIDLGAWADESHRIADTGPQEFTELHSSEGDEKLH